MCIGESRPNFWRASTRRYPRLNSGSTQFSDDGEMSPIHHSDIELHCACCGDRFVYSAGEQELHAVRGVTREPRECPPCRRMLGRR